MSSATAEALGPLHDYVEYDHASDNFRDDVLNGLQQSPKRLPSKYFYDERGSQLFDDICELHEYYPTRTEMALLQTISAEVAALVGEGATVIEFGSGSSTKIRILLDALDDPSAYVPVDISRGAFAGLGQGSGGQLSCASGGSGVCGLYPALRCTGDRR